MDITGLSVGLYSYVFEVADPNALNSPQMITVDLEVIGPIVEASNTDFNVTAYEGGENPGDRTLAVSNPGGGVLNWTIDTTDVPSWLMISSTSGSLGHDENEDIVLSVDISALDDGLYSYAFEVVDPSAENSPQTVTVNLEVIGPILQVSNTTFNFVTNLEGLNLGDQILTVLNPGGGTLNWSADISGMPSWLLISGPVSGSLAYGKSDDLTLSVNAFGLSGGLYSYAFQIFDPEAEGSPKSIQVNLDIRCYTGPDYTRWVVVGRPESWCTPYQCHGDADGQTEVIAKQSRRVGYNDINVLLTGFNQSYSGNPNLDGSDWDDLPDTWIAADFDHDREYVSKSLRYVGYSDLNILLQYFNNPDVPGDCQTPNPVSP
ncbi:MAG: hypothetical protein OEV87_11825 [Phycisphaerae bacterium]|nr:hypothetical protein [Phycisphaerae bacterium]